MAKRRRIETASGKTPLTGASADASEEAERVVVKKKWAVTRQGTLELMKEIPIDVLFEVFGHLEPHELLQLARTSKDLRKMLMSRSSSSVWKTSRKNAGIPDPVPPMSEPAFANLLFNPICHFCHTTRVPQICWSGPFRCFWADYHFSFASAEELSNAGFDLPASIWNLVPMYPLTQSQARSYWRHVEWVYLISAAKEFYNEFMSLPVSREAVRDFMDKKCEAKMARKDQTLVCKPWDDNRNVIKYLERKNVREQRIIGIFDKLSELGWVEELMDQNSRWEIMRHKLVNQSRPLTERVWGNIGTTLEAFLSSLRRDRLAIERHQLLRDRDEHLQKLLRHYEKRLPRPLFMPPLPDIVLWQPFRTIIENTPPTEILEASHYDDAMKHLPPFVQEWNAKRHDKALGVLQAHQPEAPSSDLYLATSLFHCKNGNGSVWSYPGIMAHMCYRMPDYESECVGWCSGMPSTHCEILLATKAIETTKVICQLHKLDPKTSLDTMMTLNPLVECKTCSRYNQHNVRFFVRWTSAVTRCHGHELIAVSEADEAIVVAKESQHDKGWQETREWYRCKKCDYKYRLKSVRKHLKKAHQIEENVDDYLEYTPLGRLVESTRPKEVMIYPPGKKEPVWPVVPYNWGPDSDSD
ncbi:hypothetical protein Moror_15047 [Moniliophthora roreri MCA 2997]|uniref:F-box domain-containing protein n=1 Tax=Moniliophthora roreri (strain MCA 2997) TaxID=1381753 RepID=V2WNZ4_MONRO|nr:hypothetical protein Moror_15047 [Moniliophthora roreri MCA 2997]